MDNFNTRLTSDSKDEWLTPPNLVRSLGGFDLDPCAPIVRPWDTATQHYTIEDNGLMKPWRGRVWLNPPYGRETFKWMARMAEHRSGIALIFVRTDTKGFHREVFSRGKAIYFLEGRLRFHHVDGSAGNMTANAPSCLVAYSSYDMGMIEMAESNKVISGKMVLL